MKRAAFRIGTALAICVGIVASCSSHDTTAPMIVNEKSLTDVAAALADGSATSEALTTAYLARIAAIDPHLHSVLALNPHAREAARASDARRAKKQPLSPLDGVPILIKDNIDMAGMPTTAGSFALADNIPANDSPMVKRLLDAGAVVLGKTNLSEWANIRSSRSSSGWSGVGGLTRNPYALDRSACGSSSGSGAAGAASFAAGTIGTETDGSVTCPSAMNGLVGLKPTVGLVSRTGIVPISHSQDTAGPMTRSVADAALLLNYMAGADPADAASAEADAHKTDYLKGLDAGALKDARLGVMRFQAKDYSPETRAVFEQALAALKAQGATLVDIDSFDDSPLKQNSLTILLTELKVDLNAYLATANAKVKSRTLADIIAFNKQDKREMPWFGQDLFETAEATGGLNDPAYVTAHGISKQVAGPLGIDKMLKDNNLVALLTPTEDPTWVIDLVNGDHFGASASTIPAVAGYPHLTVPMGDVHGLPVGISFIGAAWSEQTLLALGFAYEQATKARKAPTYVSTLGLP